MGKRKRRHGAAESGAAVAEKSRKKKKHSGQATAADSKNQDMRPGQGSIQADSTSHSRAQALVTQDAAGHQDPVSMTKTTRKKKHKKRKSSHAVKEASSTPASFELPSLQYKPKHNDVPPADVLTDPLRPEGLSKHQHRRWRKKLIRHGLVSKGQPIDSSVPVGQQRDSQQLDTERRSSDWIDKPIGRKALARQLATTTLMQPTRRQWDDQQPATESEINLRSTPWHRSAAVCSRVVVPDSSAAGDTDAKSAVSRPTNAPDTSKAQTSAFGDKGHNAQEQSDPARQSLHSSFSLYPEPRSRPPRHSFGSKANSVPTYTIRGDVTERFKRFSAAAHGKAVLDDDDSTSSESSSEGEAGPDQHHQRTGNGTSKQTRSQMQDVSGKDAAKRLSEDNGGTEDLGLRTLAELATIERQPSARQSRPTRLSSGSEKDLRRQQAIGLDVARRDINPKSDSQSTFESYALDDETFDPYQTVQEIFQHETTMTRELPAGKKAPTSNAEEEIEDGLLTGEFSHRRVTRSASKIKPAMLTKRMDSAMPDAGSSVVIVQSMHLPESLSHERGGSLADRDSTLRQQRSTSPLSELSRSPSPVPNVFQSEPLPPNDQPKDDNADAFDQNNIVVAINDQTPQQRKRRKMTGLTSKHFSTPKSKRKRMSQTKANEEAGDSFPVEQNDDETEHSNASAEHFDDTSTKALLKETTQLLADKPSSTDQESFGQHKKPSTRSRGNLQTQSDDEKAPRLRKRRRIDSAESRDNATGPPDLDNDEASSRPRKRPRRSGGMITDVDTSNIIDASPRTRRQPEKTDAAPAEPLNEADHAVAGVNGGTPLSDEQAAPKPKAKRKTTGKRSSYFTPPRPPLPDCIDRVDHFNTTGKKKRAPAGVSVRPVPSIHSDRFGIIQEKLWREPFWLLIAVTFLNKTAGRAAAPTFWRLKEQFQTPEALAEADQSELCDMIWHLGLQTQRSKRLIAMAKAWVEREPEAGVRWRVLHYPVKGDGKGYKASELVEDDADDVEGAIEIGRIPGCGPYAMDSWRIFCRDVLRGVAEDYNGAGAEVEGFVPEWQKVLPEDKELRACLRWMWLREGWIWDHHTGKKRRATEEEMERAVRGEMEVADEGEGKFAARAAGVEGLGVQRKEEVPDDEEPEKAVAKALSAEIRAVSPRRSRGMKRAATPDAEGDVSSDNIVVSSPAKKRRTSGRRAAAQVSEDW